MELESVRALKLEVASRIVQPMVREQILAPSVLVGSRSVSLTTPHVPAIALGVAAGRGPKDFRLAVRVQRRSLVRGNMGAVENLLVDMTHSEHEIRVVGSVRAAAARPWQRRRKRPLLIGCSVAHSEVTAGTIGGFVEHRPSGKHGILSNSHVLALEGMAETGDHVLQPGPSDRGLDPDDRVGRLLVHAPLSNRRPNRVDAAVAALSKSIGFSPGTLTGIGTLQGVRPSPLDIGDRVRKVGRTTGVTEGVVTAIEVDRLVVDFEIGLLRFDGQIEIEGTGSEAFSAGGDSGSLIVDEHGFACGLLFAGSDVGGRNGAGLTYVNEIDVVLGRLKSRLLYRD